MQILINSEPQFLETFLKHITSHIEPAKPVKIKEMARDEHGPDFDDRLIQLVRQNSAIYDVSHPHYRRTPVRMQIWDNIAKELGAPSRFLQTKWKNIRYNYLQELKCLETGTVNPNIRKRRFTEDLSFLKYTAYRRDGTTSAAADVCKNESDNENNSYMYPDNLAAATTRTSYEVIELDQSDEEEASSGYLPDVSAFLAPMIVDDCPEDPYAQPDNPVESAAVVTRKTNRKTTNGTPIRISKLHNYQPTKNSTRSNTPDSPHSNRSSPLLTPIKKLTNGSNTTLAEVTIQPVSSSSTLSVKKQSVACATPPEQIMLNAAKRKAAPTPTLQPINDPIELYCLSLVDCFRAMPRSERERVKFEFSKILKDAQYIDQL